ncbi:CDP-glycerol glycerophosphotransferase family protein [Siminovitchia sp. 179-K 8D1 HS]|uniref:CDP-glycerol glycerophosphotransferase family protein n=1 Tax=Siminovitchia sp. 179-K 8D1 HS TaxID=3142385 RepID=UPI0039A32AF2
MKLISWIKRKKKQKLKYKLYVSQINDFLTLSGFLSNNNYKVVGLWLVSRDKNVDMEICTVSPSNEFEFKVSLIEVIDKLKGHEDTFYDWYLRIRKKYEDLNPSEQERDDLKVIKLGGVQYGEYLIRCGRFQKTRVEGLTLYFQDDDSIINYLTDKGNLSLIKNKELTVPIKHQIDKIKKEKNGLILEGKLFTKSSMIENGEIVIRGRETQQYLTSSAVNFTLLKEETEEKYGLHRYQYRAQVNLRDITNGKLLPEDIYDLFFRLQLNNSVEDRYIRIGRPTFRARYFLKDFHVKNETEALVVNPYFTFKYSNLSLEVYKYPIETFNYLRKLMLWSWVIRIMNLKNDTWIVGERIYKAQDTGLAFFRYMRTKHPEKKVFYVIDKDSPEKKNVDQYGNVLEFKSKEHIYHTLIAKKVISSHHPDYLYPLRTDKFKNKVKADKVFLQHGVMGTKNMVANYGKNAHGFNTDFFIVSSDFEKEMIVNDFGYSPKEVFVTGLSRFDTLFKDDVKKKRQILIIPTWRDWIVTEEAFFESEYYERYEQLINDTQLHKLANDYGFDIIFCLHPNMQRFSQYFENPSVKIINQGEIDVQHLIKESALMITDYSSVAFDFSFLYKPVIYYQFDRSKFIGKRPSHLDLDNDLPGEICFEKNEILQLVEDYAGHDFAMKPEYKKRADKFIKFRDQFSSERIYKVVRDNKANKQIFHNPKIEMLANEIFRRYRKSRLYYPSMKLFYRIGSKIIPVDKKLILFESGLGKQYGDSPKNIYEEILKQGLDYKKVWVLNKQHRFKDPNTKRIKRLSPLYYYYLLRAGYWVNNQNFPAYIKKRPGTVYLQTWHGTPLKKMLYDIEEVHGRADDYVERVGRAIKNWDYLISPSPYATKAFRSAFRYKGEILETGYPRNDIFYHEKKNKIAEKVRKKLNLDENKKVILYAPTFRDDQTSGKNKFLFKIQIDLHKMKEQLGDEYIVLLRMHVVVSNKIIIEESLQGFVYNVSGYPDIQDLYLITNILITDYSSVMFDFANTGRPILFYTYDLDNYRDHLRGFYMDFEKEAPGPLVYNTDEIINSVKHIDAIQDQYNEKYVDFQNKYCPLEDGMASKRVVERIF